MFLWPQSIDFTASITNGSVPQRVAATSPDSLLDIGEERLSEAFTIHVTPLNSGYGGSQSKLQNEIDNKQQLRRN